jgi:O-antigen ligase
MGEYTAVLALIYFLIGAIAAIIVFAAGLADTVASLTGDATLTGRTTVWRYVLSRWEESPYVGQGYGALWSVGPQSEANLRAGQLNWTMNEAHNGYLDVLAQTGIIGVLFLGIFLCAALPTVLFARESNTLNAWKYYGTYVMIGVVLVNITESTLVKAGAGDWLLFVATFATVGLSRRPANFPQTPVGKTGSSLISVSA